MFINNAVELCFRLQLGTCQKKELLYLRTIVKIRPVLDYLRDEGVLQYQKSKVTSIVLKRKNAMI